MSSEEAKGQEPVPYQALLDENNALQNKNHTLQDEVESLKLRLAEAEELRRAISEGDLDALVLPGPEGKMVFTLDNADRAYRVLVETMNEGTATFALDGTILYCNRHFAELLKMPPQAIIGASIYRFIVPENVMTFKAFLEHEIDNGEINILAEGGTSLPVYLSISSLKAEGSPNAWCLVVTDLTEQKKNEEMLAAGRLARSIIEQAAETIIVCDTSGKIIRFSNAAAKISGCNPTFQKFEDLINLRFSGGTDAGKNIRPVSFALKGSTILGMEATFKLRDCQKLHLLLNAGPLKNADDKIIGCVVTLTDITERKRVEEALCEAYKELQLQAEELQAQSEELKVQSEELQTQSDELQVQYDTLQTQSEKLQEAYESLHVSENKFRTLAENSPDIIARFDRQKRYIYVNPAAAEPYDRSPEKMVGKTNSELRMEPELVKLWEGHYENVFASGKPEKMEFHYKSPQGKEYYFNTQIVPEFVDEEVTYVLAISRDITNIKEAEARLEKTLNSVEEKVKERTAELEKAYKSLKESEESLAEAQRMAYLGSWNWDIITNRFYLSDGIYRIFGRTPQEFGATYNAFLNCVHPEDREYVNKAIIEALNGRPYNIDHRIILANGEERVVHEQGEVVFDEKNIPIRMKGTIQDITERKKAEEILKSKLKELARSNAELEQFAYVSSHDLQEPLRMITSYLQLLQRRYQGNLDDRADKYIHFAVDGASRMQNLINDLLEFSRVTTRGREPEPTNCEFVFDQVLSGLELYIKENKATISHDPLPEVRADPTQLAQVFQNLIINGIKFHSEDAPKIHISAEKKESEWIFSVQDNGIGIDPQYSEKIFEVFKRLHKKEEYPGTGIGLAICKKIVERHSGRVWVESKVGKGSTFYFTLPINPRETSKANF